MHQVSYFCHHIDYINTTDGTDIVFCNEQSINNNSLCENHQNEKDIIDKNKTIQKNFFVNKIRNLLNLQEKISNSTKKAEYAKIIYDYILDNPIFLIDYFCFREKIMDKLNEFIKDINKVPYIEANFNPSEYLIQIKLKLNIIDDIINDINYYKQYNDDEIINDIDGSKIVIYL